MDTAIRIATKETREVDNSYVEGFAAVYRVSVPWWGCDYVRIYEEYSFFGFLPYPKWQVIAVGASADGTPSGDSDYEILREGKLGAEFDPKRFDRFMAELGYEVVEEKRYSMGEIMGAFEALREDLDMLFGEGTADRDRYLVGDVAHDVRAILEGKVALTIGLDFLVGDREGVA